MVCLDDNEHRPRKLLFGSGSLEPMDIGPQQYGQWKLEKCCGSDICCDMCALAEDTGPYRLETICGPKRFAV